MEVGNNIIYHGKFGCNILVVEKPVCGKTHFLQKFAVNRFFGKLIKTEWVSGIDIDKRREAEIQPCFDNEFKFHKTIKEPDELVDLIDKFKLRTSDLLENINESVFGKKISMDRLIVMDDVSGVAENCKKFAEFLTVCRKYKYHSIYVFDVLAPETQIWKNILSQTNIFNIFLSSVPYDTVSKILQSNCKQTRQKYIPARSMWLHRVFTDLASTNKWHCLTSDCSGVNKNGPGRYRTQADNPDKQVCYFNKPHDDEFDNAFISDRINSGSFDKGIYFQITHLTLKKLWKKMAQQMIDLQKLTLIQSQNLLEEVLENEELKNSLNQMNQELVVPES